MKRGIDISEHQSGIDYTTLAKNIDFAILREGCRQRQDYLFATHLNGLRPLGVPILGVYHFIYALNLSQVEQEAKSCIKNVRAAGLPKTTVIWADFEYDTINNARKNGVTLGRTECNAFTRRFCETVAKAGYPTGIYSNLDYANNMYDAELLRGYPLWFAQYSGITPSRSCAIWQYSSKGSLPGYNGDLDMNILYDDTIAQKKTDDVIVIDPGITADDVIAVYESWNGMSRAAGTHKPILDIYNAYIRSHPGTGRGYQVQPSDAYCATTFSAAFIKLGAVDAVGGVECGVEELVKICQRAGTWEEDGSITPQRGWGIVYNWDDDTQPNTGFSDHIGIVESVNNGQILCIEGNMGGGVVGHRQIPIGWGYIRGYIKPKYGTTVTTKPADRPVQIVEEIPLPSANIKPTPNKVPKWVGRVDADILNVRTWAGIENPNIKSYPILRYSNLVDVCDTVKASDGSSWYYVRIAGKWFGFVSAQYIIKA